jgi:uncharacterized protein
MREWALITGASSGIGLELAKVFAANGHSLVLSARNESRLNQLAQELKAKHGVETKVLAKDLSQPNAAREIFDALRDTPVSILVNNAGFGSFGPFAGTDLRGQTEMIQVNITVLVELTHLFLQPMLARASGRVLNVASTAAFQPGPLVNVYYASKAFVYSFTYALAHELRGKGITVTALCPGSTRTDFFQRSGMRMKKSWPQMQARKVAEIGYAGLINSERVVIPGLVNKITSFFAKRLPARFTARAVEGLHEH